MHYEIFTLSIIGIVFSAVVVLIHYCLVKSADAKYTLFKFLGITAGCGIVVYSTLFMLHGEPTHAGDDKTKLTPVIDVHDDDDDEWFTLNENRTWGVVIIAWFMIQYTISLRETRVYVFITVYMFLYGVLAILWAAGVIDSNEPTDMLFRFFGVLMGVFWIGHHVKHARDQDKPSPPRRRSAGMRFRDSLAEDPSSPMEGVPDGGAYTDDV